MERARICLSLRILSRDAFLDMSLGSILLPLEGNTGADCALPLTASEVALAATASEDEETAIPSAPTKGVLAAVASTAIDEGTSDRFGTVSLMRIGGGGRPEFFRASFGRELGEAVASEALPARSPAA